MSEETTNPTTARKPRQRPNGALAKSVDDLSLTVERLGTTVFQSAGKIDEFINRSGTRIDNLDTRVTVLESGALNRDEVKGAVRSALDEAGVVTQETLGVTAYRQIVGGTRRALVTLGAISAAVGGAVVAIQHVLGWLL